MRNNRNKINVADARRRATAQGCALHDPGDFESARCMECHEEKRPTAAQEALVMIRDMIEASDNDLPMIHNLTLQGLALLPTHAKPPGAWQPIETAPKDGTEILITGGTYYYDATADGRSYPFTGVKVVWLDKGEWNGGYGSEYDGEYWHLPTHWMPKPDGLTTADTEGEK